MTSLADRLRSVVRPSASPVPPATAIDRAVADRAADTLGGEWCEAGAHRFLVIDRRYSAGYRHGRVAVCDAAPGDAPWPALPLLGGGSDARKLLFIDLETTGLAGGAGTYAFLIGCGWFDGATFRLRQFFLSSFGAERALLEAVAALAAGTHAVVTFNGKSFDLPLIENRFVLHRMATPFSDVPHVDMLHPARRLWKRDEEGCRLLELEQTLLGHEREGDVPGFEIPARYFHYVRSGDARVLTAVMEHNRLDILTLALLASHAAQLLEEGPSAARSAGEAFGMGRLYERGGRLRDASACYWRGSSLPGDVTAIAENVRAYAVLARRERRFADAADAWRRLIALPGCPPAILRDAAEALAVHHEHRARDLAAAKQFALQSLRLPLTTGRRDALHHRLARLDRKLGTEGTVPLF